MPSLESKSSMIELKSAETTSSSERPSTAPKKEGLWTEIRQEKKLVWYLLALMSGVLLYGYDFVIVGTVSSLLAFQHEYGEVYEGRLIIPSNWLAGWKAASPLGCMLGSMMGGFLANKFGRRITIGMGTFVSSVGVALCIVSAKPDEIMIRRTIFLVAKFVQGGGIGQIIVAVQTYVSEVTPPRLRGPVMALIPLATLTGQLIGATVIASQAGNFTKWAIVIPLASQLAFMIPPAITAFILPESPVHLLEKKRTAGAEKALKRLSRGGADISAMAEAIQTSMSSSTHQGTYADCFKAGERPRTMIVLLAFASPQLWGVTLLANASYFMQTLGMSEAPSLVWLVVGILLGIVANLGSLWALARIGRRPLILGGYSVLFFVWLSMGIANCFASPKTLWWSTAALMIVIVVAGVSCWPAFVAVGAEVSSLSLRSKSQGIGWAFGSMMTCVFSVILPYIYNVDAGNLRGKTGFIYAALAAICLVVSWFFVPETKDMSPDTIDTLFRTKSLAEQREEEPRTDTEMEA